jgi:hypothetical protein
MAYRTGFFRQLRPFPDAAMGTRKNFFLTHSGQYLQQVAAITGAMMPPGIISAVSEPLRRLPERCDKGQSRLCHNRKTEKIMPEYIFLADAFLKKRPVAVKSRHRGNIPRRNTLSPY